MTAHTQTHRDYSFGIGLVTGVLVGVGLAMWLAPRSASELRQRMADSARNLGQRASDQYRQTSSRVSDAAAELARTVQEVRDDVVIAVAHGAHEVGRYATAAKSERGVESDEPGSRRSL